MADAEDLKSSGDFSSCGFDSNPGNPQILEAHRSYSWRPMSHNANVSGPLSQLLVGSPISGQLSGGSVLLIVA